MYWFCDILSLLCAPLLIKYSQLPLCIPCNILFVHHVVPLPNTAMCRECIHYIYIPIWFPFAYCNGVHDGDSNSWCHLPLCALMAMDWLVGAYGRSPHSSSNVRTDLCLYFCTSLVHFNSRRLVESGRHFRETVSELSHLFDSKHYPVN